MPVALQTIKADHQRQASQFSCHTKHLVSSFFPCFLDSHPPLGGFEPHIAGVFFYSFFFLRIFTDSSHKAPNCSRARGESRQVLSITSFCVGLRCCGSGPHYHKHSCFTALHKLPLKVVTKYWVNSLKHSGGMTTTWHNSLPLTPAHQQRTLAVLLFLCKLHNTAPLATSREFVCIAALQSPITRRLSSIPQSRGVGGSHDLQPWLSAHRQAGRRAQTPLLANQKICPSLFIYVSCSFNPIGCTWKGQWQTGSKFKSFEPWGRRSAANGEKNNGSGNRFFLFVCLLLFNG